MPTKANGSRGGLIRRLESTVWPVPSDEEIVQRITERFDVHRIVLFGSRARGDARPDSDVDLYVEMDTDARPVERRIAISSAFDNRNWALDVIVYTPAEAEEARRWRASFLSGLETEGKVLYAR